MARYTGPRCRQCRRQGQQLFLKGEKCLTDKCPVKKRPYPPGAQGQRRARKVSDFGQQLREKQRTRWIYGVLERQFRNEFELAEKQQGPTGENLLKILERRLDNVVYRLGFGDSRAQARQILTHGHFNLNGRKTDIPSAVVKPGDVISVRPESRESEYFKVVTEKLARHDTPQWLALDAANLSGRVVRAPLREEIDMQINEPLIVEFYSR
ncbi:MAG: 30S ribosomal protein S4 [Chloroflexota bacterium]|nr:30S ribosomal protein S4 [Chloroflexota bacterium]